ncbi:MAG TPA: LysR family transcriptional regulator [Paucimonas sp.]|nr:LysR family transcriptional regulator [Paucimonas sp.]
MSKTKEATLDRPRQFRSARVDKRTRQYDIQNFRISLKQWRMLHAVIDCGGYSDAAEFLHLSQSAISYTIGKLQDQLGIPLLRVEGRKAQITEEGRALLQRSRGLLKAALELEAYAENLRKGWRSDVRLAVEHHFPPDLLMLALRKFSTLKSNIRIHLDEMTMAQAEDALNEHAADLAICSSVPMGFLGDPLIEFEYVAVAHPDHPLFSLGRDVEAQDLERHVQIVVCHPKEAKAYLRQSSAPGYAHRWHVSSFDSALEALQEGLGYAWLPRRRVRKALDGRLAVLPMQEGCGYKTNFYLVYGRPWVADSSVRKLAEVLHGLAAARPANGEDDSPFYPLRGESA